MARWEEAKRYLAWQATERRVGSAVAAAMKAPLVAKAQAEVEALTHQSVPEFLAAVGIERLELRAASAERHAWQIGALEQTILATVAASSEAQLVFELGTFDGGTTLAVARALPETAQVHTIDLPAERFAATQNPDEFSAADVGRAFRAEPTAGRAHIVQHRADTKLFDYSEWYGKVDLVLVDGAHDREHGVADSETALRLVRPGGWIFWDDFEPYWHGLVEGIISVVGSDRLTKIARTSLAYTRG